MAIKFILQLNISHISTALRAIPDFIYRIKFNPSSVRWGGEAAFHIKIITLRKDYGRYQWALRALTNFIHHRW